MRMRRIVIRGLPGSTVFFLIILQTARFSKENKKKLIEYKMCVLIFCRILIRKLSHFEKK
jgi:hypothetical protein